MERTDKPYGGHIDNCQFWELPGYTVATGNLRDGPRNRFGFRGNFGMRTSYIVSRRKTYIETRNTIYTYTEVNDTE